MVCYLIELINITITLQVGHHVFISLNIINGIFIQGKTINSMHITPHQPQQNGVKIKQKAELDS